MDMEADTGPSLAHQAEEVEFGWRSKGRTRASQEREGDDGNVPWGDDLIMRSRHQLGNSASGFSVLQI